jgi:hypothetical protein
MKRILVSGLIVASVLALASCGGKSAVPTASVKTHSGGTSLQLAKLPASCYNSGGLGGPTHTVSATVTFYGWPDNSPPGNAIAHPVIHSGAGGDGSYCNPTTFATEPTSSENAKFPYGTVIYVPLVQKYFIREDDCTNSGPSSGSGSNGCSGIWTDLWIGGDANSNFSKVVSCEQQLTPSGKVNIIIDPPSNETVNWTGPIYSDQLGCNKGGTSTPTPSPTHSPTPTPKPTGSPSPSGGGITGTIQWYDYFDNGNSCSISHPVIHSCAGGSGTWTNPITFATDTENDSAYPYGSKIYIPVLQRYFIREDDCGSGQCPGNNFNIWIGGNSSDNSTDMAACETYLTNTLLKNGTATVITNPPSNETVTSLGQIWNETNGTCNGSSSYARVHR